MVLTREIETVGNIYERQSFMYVRTGYEELSNQLLLRHISLCDMDTKSVKNPYFEFTAGERSAMYREDNLGNGLRKRIGPIKAFTAKEMACWLETAQEAYKKAGTMGDFPKDKTHRTTKLAENELTKIFIDGFDKNSAIVFIDKLRPDGTRVVVGGLMLTVGEEDIPIHKLIGNPNASISTLSALEFELPQEVAHIGNIHAKNVFCATRLFSTADSQTTLTGLTGFERSRILPELVVAAEEARGALEKHLRRPLLLGIGDITDTRLLGFIQDYGWNLVTDQTAPTQDVLSTILKHHYRFYSQGGRKIMVIMAEKEILIARTPDKLNKLKRLRREKESDPLLVKQ